MNDTLSKATRAHIERACTRLVLDAADCTDRQDYVGLAALFQPEGRLYRPTAPDQPLEGRDAILAAYRARPPHRITRHFCTNIRVTVESPEQARVTCYVQVFTANSKHNGDGHFGWSTNERMMIGEFNDLCIANGDDWQLAERHARFVMHRER